MPQIILLIGPPGSGKSTYRDINFDDESYVFLSTDDMIDAYAQSRGMTYTEAFEDMDLKSATATMMDNLREAIKAGKNIVVDRTNMTVKSRNRILSQVPKSYTKEAVVFTIDRADLDVRLERRARETGKFIPSKVVDEMLESYQPPTTSEVHVVREYYSSLTK